VICVFPLPLVFPTIDAIANRITQIDTTHPSVKSFGVLIPLFEASGILAQPGAPGAISVIALLPMLHPTVEHSIPAAHIAVALGQGWRGEQTSEQRRCQKNPVHSISSPKVISNMSF
jgi:hypothetical protein